MGASTSIELISDGTVIPIALPVTPNMGFLSPGQLEIARHRRAGGANHARHSKRTNARSSASPLLAYLGSANAASFDSVRRPRDRRINNARRATVSKKSGFPLSGAALGGIIAASVVVLWLLFVVLYLKRRSRQRRRANVGDVEDRGLLPASYDSSSRGSLSVVQSIDSPQLKSSPAPLLSQQRSQPSFEVTPFVLPTPSNPQVPDGKPRKARLERPPPLVLRRERSDREARQGDSFRVARSRSTRLKEGSNRDSFLPNPWDSGAKPSPGAFELVFFGLPSFSAPVNTAKSFSTPLRHANSFKAGLPRTPRETRTFLPPEVRSLEVTQFAMDRTTFEPRRGPGRR